MLKLTLTGQTTDRKYPVIELIEALEDLVDDLTQMTNGVEHDDPRPFSQTYPTDCGELTATLEILMEPEL